MCTYNNLVEALRDHARDDVGIHFLNNALDDDFFSYSELLNEAGNFLSAYQSVGVNIGDEMLLLYKSPRAFVAAFWACLLGGLCRYLLLFLRIRMRCLSYLQCGASWSSHGLPPTMILCLIS